MPDRPFYNLVPGGTVGVSPRPTEVPYDLISTRYSASPAYPLGPGGSAGGFILATNGGATATNFADIILGIVCWRFFVNLAAVNSSRACVNIGGAGGGPGGFTKIGPMSSIMSGAASGIVGGSAFHYYMQTDVKLIPSIAGPGEIVFIMGPSFTPNIGTLPNTHGFGICYANSLPNDNYHIFISDVTGVIVLSVDTGIPALDSVTRFLRLEWGWINGGPKIRLFADGALAVSSSGPYALTTANRLGAFTQHAFVGVDKMQNDAANQLDAYVGSIRGLELGIVI